LNKNAIKEKGLRPSSDPQAQEFYPRIRADIYEAICYKIEVGIGWAARKNIYFRFRIMGGEYDGTELFMTCPHYKGNISPRCKYYKQWMLAMGRPPHNKERLVRRIFKNRLFLVRVRDTNRKHDDGTEYPQFMQYSIIDSIIRPLTGDYSS